jgi:hypothetical protein
MKSKIILAAIFAVSSLTTVIAQDRQPVPVEERVKKTIERLKPELTLTEQQEKDLAPVYTDYYNAMTKLREADTRPSPEDRKKLTDDRDEKLKKVLSEDQFKKLKGQEEKMMQERRRPQGGR